MTAVPVRSATEYAPRELIEAAKRIVGEIGISATLTPHQLARALLVSYRSLLLKALKPEGKSILDGPQRLMIAELIIEYFRSEDFSVTDNITEVIDAVRQIQYDDLLARYKAALTIARPAVLRLHNYQLIGTLNAKPVTPEAAVLAEIIAGSEPLRHGHDESIYALASSILGLPVPQPPYRPVNRFVHPH